MSARGGSPVTASASKDAALSGGTTIAVGKSPAVAGRLPRTLRSAIVGRGRPKVVRGRGCLSDA